MRWSDRDRRLALLLLAIVVLVGYVTFLLPGKLADQRTAAAALDAARQAAPPAEQMAAQQAQLRALQKDLHDLKGQLDDGKARWQTLMAACASPVGRNERVAKLTRILIERELDVLEDTQAQPVRDGKLSPTLEKLSTHM